MSDNGPGQNLVINASYISLISTFPFPFPPSIGLEVGKRDSNISREPMWTIRGLSEGRPFAEKIRWTARDERADAPRP